MRYTTSAWNSNTPRGRKRHARKPASRLLGLFLLIGLPLLYVWGGGDLTFAATNGWMAPVAYLAGMLSFCYVRGRYRMARAHWARRLRYYDPR